MATNVVLSLPEDVCPLGACSILLQSLPVPGAVILFEGGYNGSSRWASGCPRMMVVVVELVLVFGSHVGRTFQLVFDNKKIKRIKC